MSLCSLPLLAENPSALAWPVTSPTLPPTPQVIQLKELILHIHPHEPWLMLSFLLTGRPLFMWQGWQPHSGPSDFPLLETSIRKGLQLQWLHGSWGLCPASSSPMLTSVRAGPGHFCPVRTPNIRACDLSIYGSGIFMTFHSPPDGRLDFVGYHLLI